MSIYPITVKRESGRADSSSGGKDYHLVLIELADKRALVLKRFGKAKTWGTLNVERYDHVDNAKKSYDLKRRQKIKVEYTTPIHELSIKQAANADEFRRVIGEQYWNTIGKGNLEWLLPDADTKGVRDDPGDDVVEASNGLPRRVAEEKRRLVPQVQEKPEDRARETPVWGIF